MVVFVIFKMSLYENRCFSKHWNVAQSLAPHLRDRATDGSGFDSMQFARDFSILQNFQTDSGDKISANF